MPKDEPPALAALARLYGGREPEHGWATVRRWDEGGPDPLDEIRVYERREPVPHWHYVGLGLTSGPADGSDGRGRGFELTARLARGDEDHPPVFMANVLQHLARYLAQSGRDFAPGHTMDLNGPIELGSTTAVRHVLVVADPELDVAGHVPGGGGVEFLQLVGLTGDEVAAKKTWTAEGFSGLYARLHPLLVTQLDRPSILTDETTRAALEAGRAREGSSTGGMAVEPLTVRATTGGLGRRRGRTELVVTVGAGIVDTLCLLLPLRLGFGEPFGLWGPDAVLTFTPGAAPAHEHEPGDWAIGLDDDQVRALSTGLLPLRGTYRFAEIPGLAVVVEPWTVRDAEGRAVTTIG